MKLLTLDFCEEERECCGEMENTLNSNEILCERGGNSELGLKMTKGKERYNFMGDVSSYCVSFF